MGNPGSLLVPVALACSLCGCVPTVRKLEIQDIRNVSVQELNRRQLRLRLTVRLHNPHSFDITVSKIDFELGLAREVIGRGRIEAPADLPAHATAPVTALLAIEWDAVTRDDFAWLFRDQIPYRIRGVAQVERPVRLSHVEIDARGTLSVPNQIDVATEDPLFTDCIGVQGVETDLPKLIRLGGSLHLFVYNPTRFDIPLRHLDYQLMVGGGVAGDGEITSVTLLSPGSNTVEASVVAHPGAVVLGATGLLLGDRSRALSASGLLVLTEGSKSLRIHWRCEGPLMPTARAR